MPFIAQVEETLVETIAEFLTTNTYSSSSLYQPETVFTTNAQVMSNSGLVNCRARLFRGFPVPGDLQLDLRNGISEISVFSVPGMTRLMSKYTQDEYVSSTVPVTLTATATNNTVTFGGTGSAGQITGISVGDGQIKTAYCMRLTNTDTPTTVATTLTSLIPNATRSGTTVTVPNVTSLLTGVTSDSTLNYENALYSQMFDIRLWCPNPQSRDALGAAIMNGMSQTLFMTFADGSSTENILYRGIWVSDATEATTEWSAYYRFEVQYPNVIQTIVPGVLFMGIELNSDKLIGSFDYRNTDPNID